MDEDKPGWRTDTIFMLDNDSKHKTPTALQLIGALGIPTLFTAPASFDAVICERVFGIVKACAIGSLVSSIGRRTILNRINECYKNLDGFLHFRRVK